MPMSETLELNFKEMSGVIPFLESASFLRCNHVTCWISLSFLSLCFTSLFLLSHSFYFLSSNSHIMSAS